MFVGEGNAPEQALGVVITPALEINGNATLLIKTKRSSSSSAVPRIRISVIGGEVVGATEYEIGEGNEYRPSAILLKNITPASKIKIEGIYGKFVLETIKVCAIDDAIFYESFDYMDGRDKDHEFYTSDTYTTSAKCDNSANTSIIGIKSSYKSIYLEDKNSEYKILSAPVEENSKVLLSFQIGYPSFTNYQKLAIFCSGDARITQLNSTDQNALFTSVEKELFSDPYRNWYDYFVIVCGMSPSTTLTFKGTDICLNNVMLTPIPSRLDQGSCNATYIKANAGQTHDVQLIRTLIPNIWCPLCLPFDVTKEQMENVTGATCEFCTLSSIDDGIFKFDIATTTISAGTPFLVRVDKAVTNPEFKEVTIVNTPAATATASTEDYRFVGTYSPVDLETDGTNLFLATDGALYKPTTDGNRLGGLRAYFVVPATSGAGARVMIPEATANISGSREVSPSKCYELYDLRGQRTNNPNAKGLYIHGGKKVLIP